MENLTPGIDWLNPPKSPDELNDDWIEVTPSSMKERSSRKIHGSYNAVYTVSQDSFEIKFTLELWRDLPVRELTIGFKNVVVQRTLSEQAIQLKKYISI